MRFCKDCWISEVPLAYAFLNLFYMASDKDAWVSSQIQDNNWALTFCHPISLIRLQALAEMVHILRQHTFQDVPDQVSCKVGSSATFTVHSQYKLLIPPQPQDIAAKTLWKVASPLKVKITTWLEVCERLPTGSCLNRRHIILLSL